MTKLLEEMKQRSLRIPLPELTDEDRKNLGERADSYEARLRYHYVPASEGSVVIRNLQATGMSDDAIAALNLDWAEYSPKEQSAFEYARLLTFEPHKIDDAALQKVLWHYTPLQVLEMTMSVAGNNSINRWKEGAGIPQSAGNTFAGRGNSVAEHSDSFTTPTSAKYQSRLSVVAPVEILNGTPTGRGISTRPELESREVVERILKEAASRQPRLPMADAETVREWLKSNEETCEVTPWMQLLAVFPNEGSGRLPALLSRERKTGVVSELQKAQISWIVVRQDRAWYALSDAQQRLRFMGQTDDQIYALDEESGHADADRVLFRLAKNLGASPIALSDDDVANAIAATSPAHAVQTINLVTACAYFDRLTEAAGLPAVQIQNDPLVPGPELLKYTPEQIEAAYAGKRMPEGVAMYLVIARGGPLDGTSGWLGPASTRFTWKWRAEQKKSRFSERIGKKPLVLVFGNFTCGPFRFMYPTVEAVFDRQNDHADFIMICVREAHPTDGWSMKSNESVGVAVAQPTTFDERLKVASMCSQKLNPRIPMFVDDLHDTAGHSYSGMPARLYVTDTVGRVAYKSGRGPFGFKPEEMEQALVMLTLENQ